MSGRVHRLHQLQHRNTRRQGAGVGQVRFDDIGVSFLMVTDVLGNRLSIRPWGKIAIFFHFIFAFNYKLTEKNMAIIPQDVS